MPDETELQNLLRLKRYEQPSPEYFEQFLRDFQHRQRAELIRQPVWKIALHRVQAFFNEPLMSQFAYAGATAAVLLVAGVASVNIISSGNPSSSSPVALASASVPTPAATQSMVQHQNSMGLVEPRIRLADWSTIPSQPVASGAQSAATNPHYVIDARPVSYEPPSSF
ncbi:MAG: hypothetical protein WCH43_10050 [Verrucomicrobiota bacterium]